ncbi:hypothetical protein ACHQM5_009732 [Ranunculus cassubicifolius]
MQNYSHRAPDQCMHKNRLQEHAQRSGLPLPSYHTVNKGKQHEPKFESTVYIDLPDQQILSFTSQPFLHRKEAEQDAARIALTSILRKIKEEGCPVLNEVTTYCKSILNEFAVKMNLELPTYTTSQEEGTSPPIFISILEFHGKTYTGTRGRSKKEAEQLAARNMILNILGTDSGPLMSQIITTKRKHIATSPMLELLPIIPFSEQEIQPFKKQKIEDPTETSSSLIEFVSPVSDQPLYAGEAVVVPSGLQESGGSSAPRKNFRRKNKKKMQNEMPADGRRKLSTISTTFTDWSSTPSSSPPSRDGFAPMLTSTAP